MARKQLLTWAVGLLALLVLAVAASPVDTSVGPETVVWNGPKASPDTITVVPAGRNWVTYVDYIYVANTAGGSATSANLVLKRYNGSYTGADTTLDTLVVWQMKVPGGPAAAPALFQNVAPVGGLYKSNPGDTLKVIVTMASATSLYVACKYHQGGR
jgi:hypothetical protein